MIQTRLHTATDLLKEIGEMLDYQEQCVNAGSRLSPTDRTKLWQLRKDAKKFLDGELKLKNQCKQGHLL